MTKRNHSPHGPWLKNGNPVCDLAALPKCTATAKSTRSRCRQPAMKNGKCRFHGGKSTGARTREGIERIRKASWKHGRRSAAAKEERRMLAKLLRESRALMQEI